MSNPPDLPLSELEKRIFGIDLSRDKDETIVTTGRLAGKSIDFIIIDEVRPLIGDQLAKILDEYELRHPEEHGLVHRNGKLVKRHHPIPTTPRSPRSSKRR